MIQAMGYDVFNPLEVRPEYSADFGKKKAEKVDYAILRDSKPIMFIEAKDIKENLNNHDAQLSRYFNSTPSVKVSILTNGLKYKFFTDLKTENIMDTKPFFEFDISNVTDYSVSILQKFTKEEFDIDKIISSAEELTYLSNINSRLIDLFENPSDEFIKLLIKDFNPRVTSTVIEKFKPLVKKSIKDALLEIVSQGIYASEQAEKNEKKKSKTKPIENKPTENKATESKKTEPEKDASDKKTEKAITKEDKELLEMIKKILNAYGKKTDEVGIKNSNNSLIIYLKNPGKWFLKFTTTDLINVITRLPVSTCNSLCPGYLIEQYNLGFSESKITLNAYIDIKSLKSLVVTCYEQVENN